MKNTNVANDYIQRKRVSISGVASQAKRTMTFDGVDGGGDADDEKKCTNM